ncbi:MAG: dephospho-CoA kinase [Fibrobacterales bacterium]
MIIGITGNIASGKSEVAKGFAKAGFTVFDADTLAHELYENNSELVGQLGQTFGTQILNSDGTLNRTELGAIVFSDGAKLTQLNTIVHPKLMQYIHFKVFSKMGEDVVLDAALIIEWEVQEYFDALVVVTCDDDLRCERLQRRNNLSEVEALSRISSQMSQDEKIPFGDYIIHNSGSFELLQDQVSVLIGKIQVENI